MGPIPDTLDDLRVLLIGGDPLARGGIAAVLGGEGVAVVAEVGLEDDWEGRLEDDRPDVILLDLGLDPRAALEVLAEIDSTPVPIVALLADSDATGEARAAGARGLIARDAEPAILATALRGAARGLVVLDPSFADSWLAATALDPESLVEPLTARELEVLQLLAQGLTNKTIAARLGISDHTAKFHVNAILGKLGAGSRTEAVVRAARLGLVVL